MATQLRASHRHQLRYSCTVGQLRLTPFQAVSLNCIKAELPILGEAQI